MPRLLIKDIATAQRKLAKVIHQYERDEIKTEKFRSLVYGISKYIDGLYKFEVEQKVLELEEKIEGPL